MSKLSHSNPNLDDVLNDDNSHLALGQTSKAGKMRSARDWMLTIGMPWGLYEKGKELPWGITEDRITDFIKRIQEDAISALNEGVQKPEVEKMRSAEEWENEIMDRAMSKMAGCCDYNILKNIIKRIQADALSAMQPTRTASERVGGEDR